MNSRRPERQSGAALIIAMLVFAMAAAMAVAIQSEFDLFYRRSANALAAEQAYAYLRGAEELAALALARDFEADQKRQSPRDDLTEIWAQPAVPYPLDEGGWLSGGLTDLQGRFNLNLLRSATAAGNDDETPNAPSQRQRYTPAQQMFIRLLLSLEEQEISEPDAQLITESIADWIDSNSAPSANGAEDDYYYGVVPSYRAANRSMLSVSELRAVAYMTEELYQALVPYVTVWPQEEGGTLNIHTAPALLLRCINADNVLQPLDPADAQTLLALREESGFTTVQELLQHPVFNGMQLTGMAEQLGVSSNYFLLSARTEVAGRESGLYSVLRRVDGDIATLVRYSARLL